MKFKKITYDTKYGVSIFEIKDAPAWKTILKKEEGYRFDVMACGTMFSLTFISEIDENEEEYRCYSDKEAFAVYCKELDKYEEDRIKHIKRFMNRARTYPESKN